MIRSIITLDETVAVLVPGSIAVVVGDPNRANALRSLNTEIEIYEIPEFVTSDIPASHSLLKAHLGKVPIKRPKMHFQIDYLYIGMGVTPSVIDDVRSYLHVGGIVHFHDGRVDRQIPEPVWDIPIAKLKPMEKQYISEGVANLPPGGNYVEIGAYKGGSAVIAAIANPYATIYAVDIWAGLNPDFEVFLRHTQFFDNIVPVKVAVDVPQEGPTIIANKAGIPVGNLSIDFLFIDGDHHYEGIMTDLETYVPYSKRVCGHDAVQGSYVQVAVERYFAKGFARLLRVCPPDALRLWGKLFCFSGGGVGYQAGHALPYKNSDSSIWYKLS